MKPSAKLQVKRYFLDYLCDFMYLSMKHPFRQAILYIRSLPQMEKKDFQTVFPDANPMGEDKKINC